MKKLTSLSIFFPFYNDEKTVIKQIHDAYKFGKQIASDLEVIAIHGGPSTDHTYQKIFEQKHRHPDLNIVDKSSNREGYAVIKNGFKAATKNWIFYTDGDAQYHLSALYKLARKQFESGSDVVNGYRKKRNGPQIRIILGFFYNTLVHHLFHLPIRDVDCDYRLIRKSCLNKISLQSTSGIIALELVFKLHKLGATFSEVEVQHFKRNSGKSQFFHIRSLLLSLYQLLSLCFNVLTAGFEPATRRL